jgi:hypothetical protein
MSPIEKLGVDAVKLPHSSGRISFARFHDQMIMILQEAGSMANPIEPRYDGGKDIQEVIPIGWIQKNPLSGVSPTGYMTNGTSEFNTQWPSPKGILSIELLYCKTWPQSAQSGGTCRSPFFI